MLGKISTLNLYSPNGLHHVYFHLNNDGVIVADGVTKIEGLPCAPPPPTRSLPSDDDQNSKTMLRIADMSHQFTEQIDALQQKMMELEGDLQLQLSIDKKQSIASMTETSRTYHASIVDIRSRLDELALDTDALRNSMLLLTATPTTCTPTTPTTDIPTTADSPTTDTNTPPTNNPTTPTNTPTNSPTNSPADSPADSPTTPLYTTDTSNAPAPNTEDKSDTTSDTTNTTSEEKLVLKEVMLPVAPMAHADLTAESSAILTMNTSVSEDADSLIVVDETDSSVEIAQVADTAKPKVARKPRRVAAKKTK
jgi:hypothetical protein